MPPTPESYIKVRGKDYFDRILKNVKAFRDLQEREGHAKPRVSAWLTGLKETIDELPAFVRLAADIGVQGGLPAAPRVLRARARSAWRARTRRCSSSMDRDEARHLDEAEALAQSLGLTFSASGAASEPGHQPGARSATTAPGRCAAGPGR